MTKPHVPCSKVISVTQRWTCLCLMLWVLPLSAAADERPNILWIVVEDASPHIGCYGETTISTPAIDQLALDGIRFHQAFVTCPVCSPCRSALVTGMYQTSFGAHNHRSQSAKGKGRGGPDYIDSYRLPLPTIPRLFQNAGYFTCNSATGLPNSRKGKTDYNFVWNPDDYDASDWAHRSEGQPFFAQVQLRGGKNRRAHQHGTDPDNVRLPPYYPDHPMLRKDWAEYLNSWIQTDQEVAAILQRLEDEGIAESTAVFFLTDHGISHLRGKQFLYDEGLRVPLIVRLPDQRLAGNVRHDLVTQIDLAATSLALADIPRPQHLQGVALFQEERPQRRFIYAARDRCDETVDLIRCVRSERFKYIRNFMGHLPAAQPNRYKDNKQIVHTMQTLHRNGQLSEFQSVPFLIPRPAEELYDLANDPWEEHNLASSPKHAAVLTEMRRALYQWMEQSGDLGMLPEPVLEELGRAAGSKRALFRTAEQRQLIPEILSVLDSAYAANFSQVVQALSHPHPAMRWWGASRLGLSGNIRQVKALRPLLADDDAGVRVAAALACCRLQSAPTDIKRLAEAVTSPNYAVGLHAIRALELLGPQVSGSARQTIEAARQSPYEFTRRIATRYATALAP